MGVSCQHVLEAIRRFAPPTLALDGDPTGLQVGRADRPIERVLCCLDLTEAVAREAADLGVGLIVSHHAVVFRPLRDLRTDRPRGRILELLLKNEIAVYVPHTALDVTRGGLNDWLAGQLGLLDTQPLRITAAAQSADQPQGIGRLGRLAGSSSLQQLAEQLKAALQAPAVRVVGDLQAVPRQAAVLCGDGRSFLHAAADAGAELLVTGDIDHHSALEARALGMALLDVGHFSSERAAARLLADALRAALAGQALEIFETQLSTQPFSYL
ncbi:MAG: Nif3-like dinuclear metal center hexameric protein [Deltaproteobacteria bacterium]|nr:Nif3-like dinuclear metal center hexameric protein [Deltaproteobacteria bacterium]